MSYTDFFKSLGRYFKSIRRIKDYISFDLLFPETWIVEKNDEIEIVETDSESGKVTSFVVVYNNENIEKVEKFIDTTIKKNIEMEEKKRLFNDKVNELRNLFEKSKIENLRGIKFDMEPIIELNQVTDES